MNLLLAGIFISKGSLNVIGVAITVVQFLLSRGAIHHHH